MNLENPLLDSYILNSLFDGIYIVDSSRKIRFWSKGAERITGFLAHEVLGSSCADNILVHTDASGKSLCGEACPLNNSLIDGSERDEVVFARHKKGHRISVRLRTRPLRDEYGRVIGAVEIFNDHPEAQSAMQRIADLEKIALVDPLTRLPNRRFLETQIDAAINRFGRLDIPFGLLMMDLDGFKAVNDSAGHTAGDRMLKTVALTLANSIRSFDIVGRWGGDEFLALVAADSPQALKQVGERYRALVEASITPIEQVNLNITISVGGALCRSDDTADSIFARADALLYRCKNSGKNCVIVDDGQ
ncbi:MAG: diguanylate cyclase [Desulfatibacillaceae bacterium]|nr:diguanylate cyclase [Desulfatibacillaceae bacterium]